MTIAPCPAKTTTFFQLIDNTSELDMRDNHGPPLRGQTSLAGTGADRAGSRPLLWTGWESVSAAPAYGQPL